MSLNRFRFPNIHKAKETPHVEYPARSPIHNQNAERICEEIPFEPALLDFRGRLKSHSVKVPTLAVS